MSMPQNPLFDMIKNWQALTQQTTAQFRTRLETLRAQWYQRVVGPTPTTAMIRPLQRLRLMRGQRQTGQRGGKRGGSRVQHGRIIPHAAKPGQEKYDFTYKGKGPTGAPTTGKRLGVEGEPYDFTY